MTKPTTPPQKMPPNTQKMTTSKPKIPIHKKAPNKQKMALKSNPATTKKLTKVQKLASAEAKRLAKEQRDDRKRVVKSLALEISNLQESGRKNSYGLIGKRFQRAKNLYSWLTKGMLNHQVALLNKKKEEVATTATVGTTGTSQIVLPSTPTQAQQPISTGEKPAASAPAATFSPAAQALVTAPAPPALPAIGGPPAADQAFMTAPAPPAGVPPAAAAPAPLQELTRELPTIDRRPRGTPTPMNELTDKERVEKATEEVTQEYIDMRKGMKSLPHGFLDDMITSAQDRYNLGPLKISKQKVLSRYKSRKSSSANKGGGRGGLKTVLTEVEKFILQVYIQRVRTGRPMEPAEGVSFTNSLIDGTTDQERLVDFQKRQLEMNERNPSLGKVGVQYWKGFLKRHQYEIEAKTNIVGRGIALESTPVPTAELPAVGGRLAATAPVAVLPSNPGPTHELRPTGGQQAATARGSMQVPAQELRPISGQPAEAARLGGEKTGERKQKAVEEVIREFCALKKREGKTPPGSLDALIKSAKERHSLGEDCDISKKLIYSRVERGIVSCGKVGPNTPLIELEPLILQFYIQKAQIGKRVGPTEGTYYVNSLIAGTVHQKRLVEFQKNILKMKEDNPGLGKVKDKYWRGFKRRHQKEIDDAMATIGDHGNSMGGVVPVTSPVTILPSTLAPSQEPRSISERPVSAVPVGRPATLPQEVIMAREPQPTDRRPAGTAPVGNGSGAIAPGTAPASVPVSVPVPAQEPPPIGGQPEGTTVTLEEQELRRERYQRALQEVTQQIYELKKSGTTFPVGGLAAMIASAEERHNLGDIRITKTAIRSRIRRGTIYSMPGKLKSPLEEVEPLILKYYIQRAQMGKHLKIAEGVAFVNSLIEGTSHQDRLADFHRKSLKMKEDNPSLGKVSASYWVSFIKRHRKEIDSVPAPSNRQYGPGTPLSEVEPLIVQFYIQRARMGKPLGQAEGLAFVNSLIEGTIHQERVANFKKAKLKMTEDTSTLGTVGPSYWRRFKRRHQKEIDVAIAEVEDSASEDGEVADVGVEDEDILRSP